MFLQSGQHLWDGAAPQALLLGATPLLRLSGATTGCRVAQILADMIEIAQKGGLVPEHLPALNPDPLGPIAHRMNQTIQTPPGLPRTVSPPPPGLGHTPKGGPVAGRRTVLGLRCHQSQLLPTPRTFALPWARRYRANHRAVRLGNDLLGPHGRQHPKR